MSLLLEHAPLEGITGCIYRAVHAKYFPGADAYYTPFLSLNQHDHLKNREEMDLAPENNPLPAGVRLVPQVLVSVAHPEQFLWAARHLQALGYDEINLNAGCPSATVVTKHKGAGILEDQDALDAFLDAVFEGLSRDDIRMNVSVKTRLGLHSPSEMKDLLAVYCRYPLSKLIIHARVKDQLYEGKPETEVFLKALTQSRIPVSYNGNIYTIQDLEKLKEQVAERESAASHLASVMCGRGVLRNPALFRQIKGGQAAGSKELKSFTEELFEGYRSSMNNAGDALFRMKELWSYLGAALLEEKTGSAASENGSGTPENGYGISENESGTPEKGPAMPQRGPATFSGDAEIHALEKALKIIRKTRSVQEYLAAASYLLQSS